MPYQSVPRLFGLAGAAVLVAALFDGDTWMAHPIPTLFIVVATIAVRFRPILLTKFTAITGTGFVGLAGGLAAGFPRTALGLTFGIWVTDVLVQRKQWSWAGVNAGREVLTLAAAYGWYALVALQGGDSGRITLTAQLVPALTVYYATYFVVGRALQYYSLLARGKLAPDELASSSPAHRALMRALSSWVSRPGARTISLSSGAILHRCQDVGHALGALSEGRLAQHHVAVFQRETYYYRKRTASKTVNGS